MMNPFNLALIKPNLLHTSVITNDIGLVWFRVV